MALPYYIGGILTWLVESISLFCCPCKFQTIMRSKSEMTVLCYKCCLSRNQSYEMILILANYYSKGFNHVQSSSVWVAHLLWNIITNNLVQDDCLALKAFIHIQSLVILHTERSSLVLKILLFLPSLSLVIFNKLWVFLQLHVSLLLKSCSIFLKLCHMHYDLWFMIYDWWLMIDDWFKRFH